MRILITAGATREPIDDVRFISNVSSGATGAALAQAFAAAGHTVTLLRGVGSVTPPAIAAPVGAALRRDSGVAGAVSSRRDAAPTDPNRSGPARPPVLRSVEFSSTADLLKKLRRELATGRYDAVIMTAAVSDYRVATPLAGKLSSAPARLTLKLVRNPKLLPQLKHLSPGPLMVIGFKLTSRAGARARRAAVAAQFATGGVDAVVQNDLAEIRRTPRSRHPFWLYTAADTRPAGVAGAAALAAALERFLSTRFAARL